MTLGRFFRRILLVDAIIFVLAVSVAVSTVKSVIYASSDNEADGTCNSPEQMHSDSLRVCAILDMSPRTNIYEQHLDSMPPRGVSMKVDRTLMLGREFNDSNYLHIQSASLLGIDPIYDDVDARQVKKPIVEVVSGPDYFVDELSHSLPFLVPQAEWLLRNIGRAFRDSLQARGGGDYRIKVTSLLRTNSSVRRLRRRNGNAVNGSAHLYGTTFDISYSNFICDNDSIPRVVNDMKLLLGEILRDFRERGRCYVKHERKQACYHITVRDPLLQ